MVVQRLRTVIRELDQEIRFLENNFGLFPEGKLICTRNGSNFKWLQSGGKKLKYIAKENRSFAEQLALKRYVDTLRNTLQHNQTILNKYLKYNTEDTQAREHLLSVKSGYGELLAPYLSPVSSELRNWMNAPYEHNNLYPEQRRIKTVTGTCVRSKSEALITLLLHINRIPFRYECALQLGRTTVYPDFTIRHPETGDFFYWEHFGMMEDPAYSRKAFDKQYLYTTHGILPTVHLLMTYESKDTPLTSDTVQNIINQYFLTA